jgi:hypothetical protein
MGTDGRDEMWRPQCPFTSVAAIRQLEVAVAVLSRIPPCCHGFRDGNGPREERDSAQSLVQAAVSAGGGSVSSAGSACSVSLGALTSLRVISPEFKQ